VSADVAKFPAPAANRTVKTKRAHEIIPEHLLEHRRNDRILHIHRTVRAEKVGAWAGHG